MLVVNSEDCNQSYGILSVLIKLFVFIENETMTNKSYSDIALKYRLNRILNIFKVSCLMS
jgi:hypothetical protein